MKTTDDLLEDLRRTQRERAAKVTGGAARPMSRESIAALVNSKTPADRAAVVTLLEALQRENLAAHELIRSQREIIEIYRRVVRPASPADEPFQEPSA